MWLSVLSTLRRECSGLLVVIHQMVPVAQCMPGALPGSRLPCWESHVALVLLEPQSVTGLGADHVEVTKDMLRH